MSDEFDTKEGGLKEEKNGESSSWEEELAPEGSIKGNLLEELGDEDAEKEEDTEKKEPSESEEDEEEA
ncbi:MAG: hypothetical protein NTW73_00050 [Candidatus Parcubacteria bacterium]|nr:hypothetical protein [Candidatus Parcubacteria bacterium]